MEVKKYQEMAEIQDHHWWFMGRRFLLSSVLKEFFSNENLSILEIGCGTGANLSMLRQFGTVYAAEMDEFSRNYAREKSGIEVEYGKLPDTIPFGDRKFDLICIFDVLEHIEHDREALTALRLRLNDNGSILLTVPATKWLFGQHDKMFHHFRRYSKQELIEKMQEAGLDLSLLSYFNTFLFPLALLARVADLLVIRGNTTGMKTPPTAINKLFYRVFISEMRMIKKSRLPLGLSLMAIASSA